jgi:hypothetical protein
LSHGKVHTKDCRSKYTYRLGKRWMNRPKITDNLIGKRYPGTCPLMKIALNISLLLILKVTPVS